MKKLFLSFLTVIASFSMIAQTIVSTTAENRNAILEEFTGIHCTYCPDGHLISNNIQTANPNDYFAINIHVGSFATPAAGEPDFRTSFGTAIEAQTSLAGYPAGTVNRHLFSGWSQSTTTPGTAMSRSHWADAVDTVISKPSYVNIAAATTINLSTREMTVLVEGYFTGTGAPSSMKLNVAVSQNNVTGPQTGGSSNPSQVMPSGLYNHMHMLRHLITGQFGAQIDTTSQSTFFSRTYTWQIPANINGVPVSLGNLEVIAFIAENTQEIVTGNISSMNYVIPAGVSIIDMQATDNTTIPAMCDNTVVPSVTIKNNTSNVIADTFYVQYTYNGGTPVVQQVTTPLLGGNTTTVTFPAISLSAASNTIEYNVNLTNVTHLLDILTGNNISATPVFLVMPATPFATIYTEDFESYADYTAEIDNSIIVNPTQEPAFTLTKAGVSGLTTDLGAYAASLSSYLVNFYNINTGNTVQIMFHKLNFASNTASGVKFDYAYAQYSNEDDRLQVLASEDCGATWTTLWDKAGADLATSPAVSSGNFFPEANHWATANVDMSAFNGKSEVILSFKAISAYGNNLYIDNINIYNNTNIGIQTSVETNAASIYPNPANEQLNLSLELAENANVTYVIINSLGQTVANENLGLMVAGAQNQSINVAELAQGLYTIQIQINNQTITKKLTIN